MDANFCDLLVKRQIVFFVGSGVSLAYPARLPCAATLLDISLSSYLPNTLLADRRLVSENIWPEVFYQDLMAFIGDSALSLFAILAHPRSKPTLAHHLIIRSAALAHAPVITTNFDCLLEEAAMQQGVAAAIVLPSGPYRPVAEVPIWKVHGSLGTSQDGAVAKDLLATVSRITQPNLSLLQNLRTLLQERHVCFVGYSGRDLDIFPMIRDFPDILRPFWIDPSPSDAVKQRAQSIGADLISGTLEEVFDRNGLATQVDLGRAGIVPSELALKGREDNDLQAEIRASLALLGTDQLQQGQLTVAQQQLLLAICLRRIGEPRQALERLIANYGSIYSGSTLEDQALLLNTMARLYDCLSDYQASEVAACKGLERTTWRRAIARSNKAVSLRVQGLHALSMAKKMQLGPSFAYGIPSLDFSPRPLQYLPVLCRYLFAATEMKILTSFLKNAPTSQENIWACSAWHWYLDHKLILLAILEAVASRVAAVRRPASRMVRLLLRRAFSQASRVGDARTIAHVQKQLQRYGLDSMSGLQMAFHAYDLATDPLNQALVCRNTGDDHLKQGNLPAAAIEFENALTLAKRCGSRATALKALVGLYLCGKRIERADLDSVRGLTGPGYERFFDRFERLIQ